MQWNLHLTGESLETDLEDVLAKLVADLEEIGHKLTGATLTTDAGQSVLPVTPDVPAESTTTAASTASSSGTASGSGAKADTPPSL